MWGEYFADILVEGALVLELKCVERLASENQLIRKHVEALSGKTDPNEVAAEFERLSRLTQGDSRGWKFNREELHDR